MDDLISRGAAKEAIRKKFLKLSDRCEINEVLNGLPAADAVPVEWLKQKTEHTDSYTKGSAKWMLGCWKREQEAR